MKMQVAVFFGGRSVEHEVSVITGMQVAAALNRDRYDVIPIYLDKDGAMYTGPGFDTLKNYRDIPSLLENGRQVCLIRSGGRVALHSTAKKLFGGDKPVCLDVALPTVHGTFGEDGCLQGLFEMTGLPYTGCDVLSSAVCMDKPAAKALLRSAGLPVLDDLVLEADKFNKSPEVALSAMETHYPYPVMVKPANLGSSVGISRADNRDRLQTALELAFTFSKRALIEPALIHMREINCAVIGDSAKARASVCEEPVMTENILSYRDKYQSGGKDGGKQGGMSGQKRIIPAEIPAEKAEEIQKLAVKAFRLLNCAGTARIDFLWDTMRDGLYINELNTIPGSLAFYLWEATGLTFEKMLDEMIELAFARQRRRAQLTYSYEVNILQNAELKGKE
ncbi:MAG: D-alanine--D-alanine ligase [Oscillospiraceae bacterium]|nr:D-alanine--D-alanine ligase [Oscillospiraceae bacterium]